MGRPFVPPVERAELVENLLSSFEFESRKSIDTLWAQEAEDRIDAFERCEMTGIPAKDVFAEIEKSGHGDHQNPQTH
jgi:putative addiction module component (TIGR02574 family)